MAQKAKFATESYHVTILGKNIQLTDALEQYVREKMLKMERFAPHILDIMVTFEVQRAMHKVAILMKFLHFKIQAHATTKDLYSAIDKASDKLFHLIHKYKDKLQSHRAKDLTSVDMQVNIFRISGIDEINDEIEEENLRRREKSYTMPQIVAKEALPLKILTQEEALMHIDLSGEPLLIYRDEQDHRLKVLHFREDGQLNLIEVE